MYGCKVGTSYDANIPDEQEVEIWENSSVWGEDIEPKPIFNSDRNEGFKSYKVVVATDEQYQSGMVASWLYNDESRFARAYATIPEQYTIDTTSSESRLYTQLSFNELNSSERVIFLSAELQEVGKSIEILIDKNFSPVPEESMESYIGDINLNNQLYTLYQSSNKIVVSGESGSGSYEISWQELIKLLIEKGLIEKREGFLIENISFGVEISKGKELLVIERFENSYR
jgi:hypothetical protein